MKKQIHSLLYSTIVLWVLLVGLSCDKNFDEPPIYEEPNIQPNLTIQQLKARHVKGQFEHITGDSIIAGIVVADDKSGQFYKSLVIQDETGGILIRMDRTELYTSFPIGRKVYIKCKDLYLGDYNGLMQLGGGVDYSNPTSPSLNYIASNLIDLHVIKGSLNNTITPKVVRVSDLTTDIMNIYQNTLIQLDNFQFAESDTAKTYADPSLATSARNFTITNCNNEKIILRNSSYASFAGLNVPNGNGSITAIYSVFGSDKQLNIRDTSDVQFYNERCGITLMSIASVRALYHGSNVTLANASITGVVISDADNKNVSTGNIILQNGSSGIALYFGSSTNVSRFKMGDSIIVNVTGGTLKKYNGSLEIELNASALPSAAVASGKTVTPVEMTIQDFNNNLSNIEYTLVKIKNATASGGGTFSGNKTLTDATGSTTLYTSYSATFASSPLPTVASNWVGYGSFYNSTKELQIRNLRDVTPAEGGGGEAELITISSLRAMFNGSPVSIPSNKKIKGIVISDGSAKNINANNVVIQEGNNLSGIVIRFTSAHSWNLGDEIEVNVSGLSLEEFKGWMQVNNVPLSNATKTGSGSITPRVTTASDLLTNFETWESTLVQLNNVTISGGTSGTWGGTTTITDATGSVKSFTLASATFAGTTYPTGTVSSFTGIVTQFSNDKQVNIRNTTDVVVP